VVNFIFFMQDQLSALLAKAAAELPTLQTRPEFEAAKARYVGPNGEFTALMKQMGAVPKEQRPAMGRLVNEAKAAALARIKEAEAEFKAIVRRLQRGREPWGKLRQEFSGRQAQLLADLAPEPAPAPVAAPRFLPGQMVFLPALGLTGKVVAADIQGGRLEVQARNVNLRVSPEEVTPVGGEVGRAIRGGTASGFHRPPAWLPSLNLVGLRVDEALPLVDRLIDQAVLHGQEKVDIIHGVGTGRLKRALWDHLKHHGLVKELHADANLGVTVVDLKE